MSEKNTIMTHGYTEKRDEQEGYQCYLFATVLGARVEIPVSGQVIRDIQRKAKSLGLSTEHHVDSVRWEVPIGEDITRQICMKNARRTI